MKSFGIICKVGADEARHRFTRRARFRNTSTRDHICIRVSALDLSIMNAWYEVFFSLAMMMTENRKERPLTLVTFDGKRLKGALQIKLAVQ
jgi:hypothetical protein